MATAEGERPATVQAGEGSAAPGQWRNLAALALAVMGALIVGYFVLKPAPADQSAPGIAAPAPGHAAPSFTLTSTAGAAVDLRRLRGHPVLLNFWFTNCPPCRSEMPDLQRAYALLRSRGVVILGVDAAREDAATIRAFADPLGITYPLLVDPQSSVIGLYRVSATPSSFFIDRQGMIRLIHSGPLDAALIQDGLRGL